jgi:hypothetical protein
MARATLTLRFLRHRLRDPGNPLVFTASTSPAELARLADVTGRVALATLIITGRKRHSGRRQKSRPGFPRTQVTTPTVTGPVTITRFRPERIDSQAAGTS